MKFSKILLAFVALLAFASSCKKDFSVNADWKDITVVYGLLSQNDSGNMHYLKITKAFLGPGNALAYAKISDSSNYKPADLSVDINEFNEYGQFTRSITFRDTTITTKDTLNAIFYGPDQIVYKATAVLNDKYTYKLKIHNNKTGSDITSQTKLISSTPSSTSFSIQKPDPFALNENAVFISGTNSEVDWTTGKEGRRYQLVIRFHYTNNKNGVFTQDSLDWLVFSDELSKTIKGGEPVQKFISGSAFFSVVGAKIPVDPDIRRIAGKVDYIFSVASEDLTTYMAVTEPSTSIVQYRPPYTNITNGIGLFSSRYITGVYGRKLGDNTKEELKNNPKTAPLNFY